MGRAALLLKEGIDKSGPRRVPAFQIFLETPSERRKLGGGRKDQTGIAPGAVPKGECTNETIKPSFNMVKPDAPPIKRGQTCPEIFAPRKALDMDQGRSGPFLRLSGWQRQERKLAGEP
jgi:hypothetical protein